MCGETKFNVLFKLITKVFSPYCILHKLLVYSRLMLSRHTTYMFTYMLGKAYVRLRFRDQTNCQRKLHAGMDGVLFMSGFPQSQILIAERLHDRHGKNCCEKKKHIHTHIRSVYARTIPYHIHGISGSTSVSVEMEDNELLDMSLYDVCICVIEQSSMRIIQQCFGWLLLLVCSRYYVVDMALVGAYGYNASI